MRTKTCPMCQGNEFFISDDSFGPICITTGWFKKGANVYCSVCLSCGFVSPTVDPAGLAVIRETARMQADTVQAEASKKEVPEL